MEIAEADINRRKGEAVTTRRAMLKGTGVMLAGLASTDGLAQMGRLPDVGRKFAADGQVLPFKGNTIICHLPQQGEQSAPFDALLDLFRSLPSEGWARKMTALPPSSYHMTIFGGANHKDRRYPLWPKDVSLNADMAECNRELGRRLREIRLGEDHPPYRMRVKMDEPPASETPMTIRLTFADKVTELRLRRLRDRLSKLLAIEDPGHDNYGFHITIGYLFAELSQSESIAFRSSLRRWKADIADRVPVIELGAPEYCTLDDMFAFKRQFFLT